MTQLLPPRHMCLMYIRLRRLAGRAKRAVQKAFAVQYANLRHLIRILRSDYPELVCDSSLEHAFTLQVMPALTTLYEDDRWQWLEISGFKFWWPRSYSSAGLPWVYQEVFSPADRNPHAYEYQNVHLEPGSWVLDGGACEGFFVHYALSRGCNVIAVEPVPAVAEALQRTFEIEIDMGRVRVINAALGDDTGVCSIAVPNSDPTMTEIVPGPQGNLPLITIDDLVKTQRIRKLDFLKLDIEGAEIVAMRGASDTLRLHRPAVSIAVYHDVLNAAIIRQFVQVIEPTYSLCYRGVWLRPGSAPRPYMLLGTAP